MPRFFNIPKDYKIDWSKLSVLDKDAKLLILFFYAQRGKSMSVDSMEMVLQMNRRRIRKALLKITEYKGE